MDNQSEDQKKTESDDLENQTNEESKKTRQQLERRLKRKTVSDLNQIAQNHKLDFKTDMRKSERIELLLKTLTVEQLEMVLDRLEKRSWIERFEEQSKHPVLRAIAWIGAIAGGLAAIWAIFFTAVIDPIISDTIVIKGRILSNMIEEIPIKGITVRIASFGSLQTQSDDAGLFELNVPELKPGDHVQLICNHKTHDRGYTCFTPWKGRFNIARDPKHVQIFYLCPNGVYPSTDDWSKGLGIAAINRSSSQLAIDGPIGIEARISPKSEINRTITTMAKMLEVNPDELMQQFKKWASSKNELDSIENKAAKEYANGNYLESAKLLEKAAESSNDTVEKRAILHKQVGDSYYADQKYETAKKQYEKTLALYEAILEKTPQQTWELRLAIANSSLRSLELKMDNKVLDVTRDTISDFLQIEKQYIDLANEAKKNGATSEWSVIQSNCGYLFNMLANASRKGTYRKYFELSEEYFRNALTAQRRYSYATISSTYRDNFNPWAQTQFRLSAMLINKSAREDSISESNATLKRAEIALRNALEFYTKGNYPQDWATLQYNLGMLEHMRQKKNVLSPEAPHHYVRAIEALNNSLEIIQKETNPRFWGQIHYQLGSIYQTHALANSGSKALELFNTAEAQYKKSLQVYTNERKPIDIADVQIDLGLLYSNLANIQSTKYISHLEKATIYFKKAVAVLDSHNKRPERWAFAQLSLSKTYAKQAEAYSGKKAVRYLKEGETSSRNALKVYSKSEYIDEWAEIQGLLGQIYRLYALHNNDEKSVDDLKTAIDLYKKSLVYFKEDTHPIKWGHAKYGIALSSFALAQHFKEETAQTYINQSMTVYQEILRVWTKDSNPIHCAYAKREYGKTLIYFASNLSSGDESIECYQLAERTFQDALTVFTIEKNVLPNERAVTMYLLGNAQAILANNLVDEELAAKYYEKAKKSYQQAMDFFSILTWPNEWADTQYNLGLLHSDRANRATGKDAVEYFKKGEQAYLKALSVFTLKDYPDDWVKVQDHLTVTYSNIANRSSGEFSVKNNKKAIIHLKNILDHLKPKTSHWASRQNELAYLLMELSKQTAEKESKEYLSQAFTAVQKSLSVTNQESNLTSWAAYQDTLGVILMELGKRETGPKRQEHFQNAEKAFKKSLGVFTKETHPNTWEEVNGNYEQLQKLIMEVEMQSNESSVIFNSNQLDSIVAI